MYKVKDVRQILIDKYNKKEFVKDRSGVPCVEIININFIADEESIFGTINENWCNRELEWYNSQSLSVFDIPEPIPVIWKQVSSNKGLINSNYGWCIYSERNCNQYKNCLQELIQNPYSRRATMIYNRPFIWEEYNYDNMNDFICTYATQHFIRNDKLESCVIMRSNDAVHGYKGDRFWQQHIHEKLYKELLIKYPNLKLGNLYWNVMSLHVYERHFYLIKEYCNE